MAAKREQESILVVDDAPDTVELVRRHLTASDYHVLTAGSVDEAIGVLDTAAVDLVITDLKMPKVDGNDLVRHVRENHKNTEVMMITGYPTVEGAVNAIKAGSREYLTKPFTEEELLLAVRRVLEALQARRNLLSETDVDLAATSGLIGGSRAMREVCAAIGKAATTRATVLVLGESGTGKELVARAIHYAGKWASTPFVAVNCGSIPQTLLESELFGHVKGAFTGAGESRAGFFQTADGGSIFLDEISDTSLAMQSRLLRVLQEREIYMVGSSRPRSVDVRVIAATNKDLRTLVRNGTFREDLYFRLNVIAITLPPLREREDDVLLLASHYTAKYARELDRPVPRFSDDVLRILRNHTWPGNVRELQNLVQRLVVMTEGDVIEAPDLPSTMRFSATRETGRDRTLAEVEAEHILGVLAWVDGNKSRAARILGIDRKTLREKLKGLATGSD